MVRTKLAAAILGAGMLWPGLASALGVGDYSLKSYLNQPLELEIDLIETGDLSTEEVLAALASEGDFSRAGVERLFFLTDIRFEVRQRPNGGMVVVAQTRKPVTEPFLNFLVEVQWPQGRLLREYTILLDPPVYKSGASATATEQPLVVSEPPPIEEIAAAPAPMVQPDLPPPPSGTVAPAGQPAVAVPRPAAPQPSASGDEYRVQANDTLGRIAADHRGSASLQQTMIAIQRANPEAFIQGNINLVKKGAVLRIPAQTDIQQVSTADAKSAVAAQNRAWRELLDRRGVALPTDRAQLEAGRGAGTAAAPARGTGAGEGPLVAPPASGAGARATGGNDAALKNQLAAAEEGLDKAARENKELASRLSDLERQVKGSEKLLNLKNDEIATLQAELNRLRKEKGLAPVETPPPAEVPAEVAAEPAAAPAETAAVAEGEQPAAAEKPAKKEKAEKKEKAKADKPQPPPESPSLLLPLAGLLALLGIGGGAFWFLRKRRQAAVPAAVAGEESLDDQVADDLAQLSDLQFGAEEAAAGDDGEHAAEQEAADPIGEADMYMAYGRFQQAADILYAALQREPERNDIRLKLAEVYAEMGDASAAAEQASAVEARGNGEQQAQARAVLARVGGGAAVAVAGAAAAGKEEELPSLDDLALEFSAGQTSAEEALSLDLPDEPVAQPAGDDLEFSLDDFEAPAEVAAADSSFEELSLEDADLGDFGLEEAKPAAAPADEFVLEDEFALDSFEEPAAAPAVAETTLDDSFGELELDEAPTAVQPALADSDLADFEAAEAPAAGGMDLESELADLEADLSAEGVGTATDAGGDDFDFLADSDENATKLDLAKAYIDMGDADGARDILNEVVADGNDAQKAEARQLLSQVG